VNDLERVPPPEPPRERVARPEPRERVARPERPWERVARSEEVSGPRFVRREAHGRPALLTRLSDGTPVAFGPICPHQGQEMDEGVLWDDEIDCPHHHYTYDPHTGENRYPRRVFPARRAETLRGIQVFEAREEDGWVWVKPALSRGGADDAAP
jgi:nitrite reductase/ring-hydroxylating ferredoxin subunit